MSTPPKRDARTVLFTGLLLLVPLAALWLLLNPVHGARHGGGGAAPWPWIARAGQADGPDGADGPADSEAPTPPALPAPPVWPPPRVASGAPKQSDWTLLAVTLAPANGILTPPAPLAPPAGGREPDAVARNPFLQVSPGAVALWIGVRGGVGIKTLTIPQDGRRHAYPFGGFSLVSQPQPSGGPFQGGGRRGFQLGRPVQSTLEWEWTGAASPVGPGGRGPDPYRISSSFLSRPGRPSTETVTLTPSPFSARFRVTALPLSADGRPTGKAVALLCQPVTAAALLAQIPAGYDARTRQFRVTVARAGGGPRGGPKGGEASWLVTGLPPAAEDAAQGGVPPAASARFGPFRLRAVAAEAADSSGWGDVANPPPPGDGLPSPINLDGHQRTGLPTLRFLLLARAVQPAPPGQAWLFQLDRAVPQWGVPPPPAPRRVRVAGITGVTGVTGVAGGPGSGATGGYWADAGTWGVGAPLGVFPLSPASSKPDGPEWLLRDGAVGAAWPGQQHWVTLAGAAIRSASRTETVTFHDAEVVHDAGFGGDRIVWRHPETETTPSGITVTVLNGLPGRRETTGPSVSGGYSTGYGGRTGGDWWYDRGNAELLLAWRMPPGFQVGTRAALNAPRVAFPANESVPPPEGATPNGATPGAAVKAGVPLAVSWDSARPDPYVGAVSPPGARDARPLARAGYTPLRLSVWAAQTPRRTLLPEPFPLSFPRPAAPAALPPYSWRDGPFVVTAAPLPRRLAAITFRITIREEQERRPVVLRVPVSAALPPGADPRSAPLRAAPAPLPVLSALRRRDTGGRLGAL